MKTATFLLIICLHFITSYGQQASDTSFALLKGHLPLPVDRYISLYTYEEIRENSYRTTAGCCPAPSLTIRSDSAMVVNCIAAGTVDIVFEVDNFWTVFVRHGRYAIAYSNLDTVLVKKGDALALRQPIGKAIIPGFNKLYEVEVILMDTTRAIDPYPWFSIYKKSSRKDQE